MTAYFIRRLLLIPVTLIGITMLVFAIVRLAPGGPVEKTVTSLMGNPEAKQARGQQTVALTPTQVLSVEEKHNRHKGIMRGYLEWLGVLPLDFRNMGMEIPPGADEVEILIPDTADTVTVVRNGDEVEMKAPEGVDISEWRVRLLTPEYQVKRWKKYVPKNIKWEKEQGYRAVIYQPKFDGLLQGSLSRSEKFNDPVWKMILERIPVSLFFGGISMILIYGICLPLGVLKAIKHRTWIDNVSSLLVFGGYAIPGYALGTVLILYGAAKADLFALGGFVSENFDQLSTIGKIKDLFYHGTLPMICYVIGSFAVMTMMMKNNLMDHLAADYVRTAVAKGAGFRRAVFGHAFRNSMIPIVTTIGYNLLIFVSGSILIERVFDINGFGLLSFTSLLEFDEPVIMGVLFVSSTLMLLGNVISDFCVALVDPRVSYK